MFSQPRCARHKTLKRHGTIEHWIVFDSKKGSTSASGGPGGATISPQPQLSVLPASRGQLGNPSSPPRTTKPTIESAFTDAASYSRGFSAPSSPNRVEGKSSEPDGGYNDKTDELRGLEHHIQAGISSNHQQYTGEVPTSLLTTDDPPTLKRVELASTDSVDQAESSNDQAKALRPFSLRSEPRDTFSTPITRVVNPPSLPPPRPVSPLTSVKTVPVVKQDRLREMRKRGDPAGVPVPPTALHHRQAFVEETSQRTALDKAPHSDLSRTQTLSSATKDETPDLNFESSSLILRDQPLPRIYKDQKITQKSYKPGTPAIDGRRKSVSKPPPLCSSIVRSTFETPPTAPLPPITLHLDPNLPGGQIDRGPATSIPNGEKEKKMGFLRGLIRRKTDVSRAKNDIPQAVEPSQADPKIHPGDIHVLPVSSDPSHLHLNPQEVFAYDVKDPGNQHKALIDYKQEKIEEQVVAKSPAVVKPMSELRRRLDAVRQRSAQQAAQLRAESISNARYRSNETRNHEHDMVVNSRPSATDSGGQIVSTIATIRLSGYPSPVPAVVSINDPKEQQSAELSEVSEVDAPQEYPDDEAEESTTPAADSVSGHDSEGSTALALPTESPLGSPITLESVPATFLGKAFEDLPFGPDVPAASVALASRITLTSVLAGRMDHGSMADASCRACGNACPCLHGPGLGALVCTQLSVSARDHASVPRQRRRYAQMRKALHACRVR